MSTTQNHDDDIAFDIKTEIQDVKPLLGFRSVSMPQKSVIDSSKFIGDYKSNNNYDRAGLMGDDGLRPAAYYLLLVKKLALAFQLVCIGGQDYLITAVIKEKIEQLKACVGTASAEYTLVHQISLGFKMILEDGVYPKYLVHDKFKEKFDKLTTYFEQRNLTREGVFNAFGRKMKDAAEHLRVDVSVLKRYLKRELKIPRWPLGKAGKKVLIQVEIENQLVYAFDLAPTAGVNELREKMFSELKLLRNVNYTIYYPGREGQYELVDTDDDWSKCKAYFNHSDRIRLTLPVVGY